MNALEVRTSRGRYLIYFPQDELDEKQLNKNNKVYQKLLKNLKKHKISYSEEVIEIE